jgi:hypothetical protein
LALPLPDRLVVPFFVGKPACPLVFVIIVRFKINLSKNTKENVVNFNQVLSGRKIVLKYKY